MRGMTSNILLISVLALAVVAGCKKNSTEPVSDTNATEDAAASIASSFSDDGGGVADQMGDATDLASSGGIQAEINANIFYSRHGGASVDTSYDAVTKTWTITINRSRTSLTGVYSAGIYRKYSCQFLNKSGQPQKYFVVPKPGSGPDTAYTILFKILQGNGYRIARYLTQRLDSLSGDWTITGTNTPTVTINGSYYKRGADTLTTRNAVRTLNHELTLAFTNCTAARGNRSTISQTMSGTVSGTYNATISVTRGEVYNERSISRTFTVTFSGGTGTININGNTFTMNMRYGELTSL
ncbi:MAG: hypothetical protein WBD36_05680 [Bacteroidota bacterium]